MHLSFVLVFALNIFAVMGYGNYYHASVESEELEEQDDPFKGNRCECQLIYRCPSGNRDLTVKCRNGNYVNCCYIVLQSAKPFEYQTPRPDHQSVTYINDHLVWSSQQNSPQITTQFSTWTTSSQPITRDPPAPPMTSRQILFATQTTPPMPEIQTQLSAQIPTKNQTSQTKPQRPVLTSSQTPITSTSPLPQLTSPSDASPSSNVECVCTPFFICYDEEKSSNLTNVVDDRSNIPSCQDTKAQKTCSGPNDVCCCNLEKPPQQPRQPRPSTTSPNCEGNCRLINDCPDKSISGTNSEQGNCIDPDHVCCQELVLSVSPNTSNLSPSSNPQPSSPSKPHSPVLTSSQTPITSTSLQPQLPSSSVASPSSNDECVCTPFFICYDEETSSNLTNVVDDRSNIPSCQYTKLQKTCPGPNDVCCCNLEKPSQQPRQSSPFTTSPPNCEGNCRLINDCPDKSITGTNSEQGTCIDPDHVCCHELVLPESSIPSVTSLQTSTPSEISSSVNATTDCTGSCVPITECPKLSDTLKAAKQNDSGAIQKLRQSVCSNENKFLHVCCQK